MKITGLTPLHLAALRGNNGYTEMCSVLIRHGAELNIKDNEGNTYMISHLLSFS